MELFLYQTLSFVLMLYGNLTQRESKELHFKELKPKSVQIESGKFVDVLGKEISGVLIDKKGRMWFPSNAEGLFVFNGERIIHYQKSEGLICDFVNGVYEDSNGFIWCTTRDGICKFDGVKFTDYTDTILNAKEGIIHISKKGIVFNRPDGLCYYDGRGFTFFKIHPEEYTPPANNNYRPYSMYASTIDESLNLWIGTQEKGVCVYNGFQTKWITGKYLDGPAVRAVFTDRKGVHWFGNNGGGLFRYDGKELRNISEEKMLMNDAFLKAKLPVDKPGSLARVFAINEDVDGNLWIGTVDAGLWKYDGQRLTNFTKSQGLPDGRVLGISKDQSGDLLVVTNEGAICRIHGGKIEPFSFK